MGYCIKCNKRTVICAEGLCYDHCKQCKTEKIDFDDTRTKHLQAILAYSCMMLCTQNQTYNSIQKILHSDLLTGDQISKIMGIFADNLTNEQFEKAITVAQECIVSAQSEGV